MKPFTYHFDSNGNIDFGTTYIMNDGHIEPNSYNKAQKEKQGESGGYLTSDNEDTSKNKSEIDKGNNYIGTIIMIVFWIIFFIIIGNAIN